jgi:transcription initiation factor TFIID subunit 15
MSPNRREITDMIRFVEYETAADLATAVEKLDNHTFKDSTVRCISDVKSSKAMPRKSSTYLPQPQSEIPRPRERYRSRSPGYRGGRGYGPPPDDYYDRRGPPPRGFSPRRDDYRRRTPPPRGYYDDPREDRFGPPPPRGRPMDDYPPPPRARYPDDRYGAPPPPRGYGGEPDPYMNGHGREPYARAPSPRGGARGYDRGGYEAPRYW